MGWRGGWLLVGSALAGCAGPVVPLYSPNLVQHQTLPRGLPECEGRLLNKQWFVVCHDADWKIARWVGHYVTPADLIEYWPRHQRFFHRDRELPSDERSDSADYEGSGYDRGHMAPAGDFKRSLDALRATFVMSNMAPQTAEMNRGEWRKLEHSLRAALPDMKGILIYTGNLFLAGDRRPSAPAKRIGVRRVAVPTHCFKVVAFDRVDGGVTLHAFLMVNGRDLEERPLAAYQLSVDELERLTGLDFFPEKADWVALEAELQPFVAPE